ncbi:MAG: MSEP-CTERM sorting domain-containing protein [Flavobacteriales bacterium]|nr:MSEP-CTERM sorting domain-containing protein [Flavobacteriales bacterium]
MRPFRNPIGILIAHVVPAALLAFLLGDVYSTVHSLLPEESLGLWRLLALLFGSLVLGSTIYSLVLWKQGRDIHFLYGIVLFAAYVPMLWYFVEHYRKLIPWDVPRWMVSDDMELLPFRLLGIPLLHALFVLVASTLREESKGNPLRDLLIAAGIPLSIYLFVQVVEPWRFDIDFERHVWVVLFVCLCVAFLFFVFRGAAALVMRTNSRSVDRGLFTRIVVALVLPLLGLFIHNVGFGGVTSEARGIFGNLSHWSFYVIALLNGAVVVWPSSTDHRLRFIQFILRSIGFTYVLYFFVLFVPWVPLSVIAIIAFGLGFLLLAPVLLVLVQGKQLADDARHLRSHHGTGTIVLTFMLALCVIPGAVTVRYLHHRAVLHEALQYVYHADPAKPVTNPIDAVALRAVLDQVDANQERWSSKSATPFLTPYYNRIVLDNLTLGRRKHDELRLIFLNEPPRYESEFRRTPPPSNVRLDSALAKSRFDAEQQVWRTWVHLQMTNLGPANSEFVTRFQLPDGAWISDTYLTIAGERVPGILAEKKAAEWVYQQIVNVQRDPSILRYLAPGELEYRVFPFADTEVRTAGIEVLHREPFLIDLSGQQVLLGDTSTTALTVVTTTPDGAVTYVPQHVKTGLTRVRRKPVFHMVLDATERWRAERDRLIAEVDAFVDEHRIDPDSMIVHLCDAYDKQVTWNEEGKESFRHHVGNGGFFSDRVMRRILVENCAKAVPTTPIIVLGTGGPSYASESYGILLDDLDDVATCLPEGASFIVLGQEGNGTRSSFTPPYPALNSNWLTIEVPEVLAWPDARAPTAYLKADSAASIVVDPERLTPLLDLRERQWMDMLGLEGHWRRYMMHGESPSATWLGLVRGSFQAQVLMPPTAWMCLESDAQRETLMRKQRETLSADPGLDVDEDTMSMSEPGLWWLLLALPVLYWRRRSRI